MHCWFRDLGAGWLIVMMKALDELGLVRLLDKGSSTPNSCYLGYYVESESLLLTCSEFFRLDHQRQ